MSIRTHCTECLHALRRQAIAYQKRPNYPAPRQSLQPFSTSRPVLVAQEGAKNDADSRKPSRTAVGKLKPEGLIQPPIEPPSATQRLAKEMRKAAPGFTETYVAYGACEQLVKECARVADYSIPQTSDKKAEIPKNEKGEDVGVGDSWWYQKLGMTPTFNTWAQITFLHMYLLTVRLRCFPAEHAPTWNQHLTDHFFHMAEDRMILLHRLNTRMMRSKYLKDLFVQWRGLTVAYDEGLVKGDAVLAAAVWRNVCKGDENIDLRRLAEIVSYMRSVLADFDKMDDEVIGKADIVFGDPSSEEGVVKARSKLMDPTANARPQKAPAKPMTATATAQKK